MRRQQLFRTPYKHDVSVCQLLNFVWQARTIHVLSVDKKWYCVWWT